MISKYSYDFLVDTNDSKNKKKQGRRFNRTFQERPQDQLRNARLSHAI